MSLLLIMETEPFEYETSGEEYWRVIRLPELASVFGFKNPDEDLPRWHDVMAGQARAWEIIRRLFRVFCVLEPGADDVREWTRQEIAEKYGISEAIVEDEISNAVKEWGISRARANVKQGLALISEEEMNHLTRFSSGEGMTEEEISRLLKAFSFDHIQKDAVLRAEVASRIISLKDWLNSPHTRASARDLIRMEIAMHTMDAFLIRDRNRLAKHIAEEEADSVVDNSTAIDDLRKKIGVQETQMRQTSEAHAEKQKAINANDLDMAARKRIYVETVTYLIDQCRKFEEDPENWRPDGVFTAEEIDWQLEPKGDRKPQYRMDIVIVANEAMKPENLWNPKYMPTKVTRRVCEELARMYNRLRDIPEDAEPLLETHEDEDDDEEESGVADDVNSVPIGEAGPAIGGQMQRAPAAAPIGVF